MGHNISTKFVGAVGAMCLFAPVAAFGQEAPGVQAAKPGQQLDEIIVTARRTKERLQTTPVAVTALSAIGLERAQIVDVAAIQRAAPNLIITRGTPSASGFAIISMRGQSNLNAGNASDPAVGIYIDGAYIARPAGALFDLVDMDQVEVLRGPQGTLFGRNTIGGALNMTTAQPTNHFSVFAEGTIGNYKTRQFTGVVNLPLKSDELAVRVAYKYQEHDGYGTNLTDNSPYNDKRGDNFVRAQVRWSPAGSSLEATLSADYSKSHDSGQLSALTGANPLVLGPLASSLEANYGHPAHGWYNGFSTISDPSPTALGFKPRDSVKSYGTALRVNADLGGMKFKSITAWRLLNSDGSLDLDGTPTAILEVYSRFHSAGFSQELQLAGDIGKFSWIGGLFYFDETGTERSDAQAFGFAGAPYFRNFADIENRSMAAYGQAYYQISDKLRASAGIRYTKDDRKVVTHNLSNLYPPTCDIAPSARDDGASCSLTQKKSFDYPAYTVGLDFQATSNLFLYVKSSGAFMAGGFNLRQLALPAFKPEGVKDVEFGIKADWLNHHLRTNIAVFHSWQTDVQRNISAVVGTTTTQFIRNAGNAQVSGLEFEGTAIPWKGFELTAQLGLLHARYDNGSFLDTQTIAGIPGCSGGQPVATYNCTVDRSGEKLPEVPSITYGFGATQTLPIDHGEFSIHADYSFVGKQSFAPNTPAAAQPAAIKQAYAIANDLSEIKGYGLLNARAMVKLDQVNMELSLWGRNLTGKRYYTRSFSDLYTSLGVAISFVGDPRTYGITATYRFGS
jgi:iron complex outermembrane receptor protein